jgi:hypothetical protein
MDIAQYFDFGAAKIRCYDFIDPKIKLEDQIDILREDMGWIEYNNGDYVIDYGWKPDFDINGEFIVYLIKNEDWDCPVKEMRTRDISIFLKNIQECIDHIKLELGRKW